VSNKELFKQGVI